MTELRMILRWLAGAAMLQSGLILLVHLILAEKLSAVRSGLTDSLYRGQVGAEQVDNVNQVFSSLSGVTLWVFLAGIASTGVGYGLLRSIIIKKWPKPRPLDNEGS